MDYRKNKRLKGKKYAIIIITFLFTFSSLIINFSKAHAAALTEFSIRPSRVEVSVLDVNFLIKVNPVTTATENGVQVTFGTGYAVDSTASNITVSTTAISSWDAECTNAWPGIGTASNVTGQIVTFPSTELTVASFYCFIITAGIDNPGSIGQYPITVTTRSAGGDVDTASMSMPIVDDDEVVITASVSSFVRCDVTTTSGADNAVALGAQAYGAITSSADDIQIQGGTNATEGMAWYYRSDAANNGLFSTGTSALLDGPTAEGALSTTTADCTGAAPCYGIYYNGTTTAGSGAFTSNASYTGGTVTTNVGPMTTNVYGNQIGTTGGTIASQVTANFNVNATAAENSPVASDYTDTLIFTCKADI